MRLAIVGCEASGKTVFMSALADYFGRDALNNPMRLKLTPENAAANKFERLMFRQMRCQRQWPPATPPDRTTEIKWALRRQDEIVASVDLLEFGGETFRAAFREHDSEQHEGSIAELIKYLGDADCFIVLVSIKALLANPNTASENELDREAEALWVTRGILDFIRKNRPNAGIVIGLTQADKYRNELGEAGSPKRFFTEYWPTVAPIIGDIPVVDVASVSKTDENGNPAEGYRTHGILPAMRIFAKYCFGSEEALESGDLPHQHSTSVIEEQMAGEPPRVNLLFPDKAAPVPESGTKKSWVWYLISICALLLAIGAGGVFTWRMGLTVPKQPKVIAVTNTVEKLVEKVITNNVKQVVEVPITNTVEKLVEKIIAIPITNTIEKRIEIPVTNTVEKRIEIPVTNTVEKCIEIPVTNTIEKLVEKVIEKVVTNIVEKPIVITQPPTNTVTDTDLQRQVPPGYRLWRDHSGRKIVAKWIDVAADQNGITIVTRNNHQINAVLWKFSLTDQEYIKSEIKRHADRGEIMENGKWVRDPAQIDE